MTDKVLFQYGDLTVTQNTCNPAGGITVTIGSYTEYLPADQALAMTAAITTACFPFQSRTNSR